ncbi:hypothetical protein E4T39_08241 [Aureobasidium subglaciale]|nr:hypothetical protein E4T39_08241 [Aureobasidium subglaciale]
MHHLAAGLSWPSPSLSSDVPEDAVSSALQNVYQECEGSFACVATIGENLLIGFRDAYGIKPLILGRRQTAEGTSDFMLASESVALEKLDYEPVQNVNPDSSLNVRYVQIVPRRSYTPDIFEYVYFARSGSIVDCISVYECRKRMGSLLAATIVAELQGTVHANIDVVVLVPETGYISALAVSTSLDVPLSLALARSSYSNRTFILSNEKMRSNAVWRKFNVAKFEVSGKNVLVVDDSIVRGSTSRELVRMFRKAGARKIIFASSSPAIRYVTYVKAMAHPNALIIDEWNRYDHIHGIDLADSEALVAYGRNNEEIAEVLGADKVFYLPLESLIACCLASRTHEMAPNTFETGVFSGRYVSMPRSYGDAMTDICER